MNGNIVFTYKFKPGNNAIAVKKVFAGKFGDPSLGFVLLKVFIANNTGLIYKFHSREIL